MKTQVISELLRAEWEDIRQERKYLEREKAFVREQMQDIIKQTAWIAEEMKWIVEMNRRLNLDLANLLEMRHANIDA